MNSVNKNIEEHAASGMSSKLQAVPPESWSPDMQTCDRLMNVWMSRKYLVQLFAEDGGVYRLSICRTEHDGARWLDGITWDELQDLKRQAGFGDSVAVELYPDDNNVVNVANMRHLWLLPEAPEFMWMQEPQA